MKKIFCLISFLAILISCSTNSSQTVDKKENINIENTNTKTGFIDIDRIINKDFKKFISHFKKSSLPFELIAQKDYGFDTKNSDNRILDTMIIHSFICQGVSDCLEDEYASINYYYAYILPIKTDSKYVCLIYYRWTSETFFYILKTYSLEGKGISSIEFCGINGEIYQIDGIISEDLEIKTKKINLIFPENVSGVIKRFKITKEENIYQINKEGKIELLSASKSKEIPARFKSGGHIEEIR